MTREMVGIVARRELREWSRDARLWIAGLLVLALTLAAVAVGANQARQDRVENLAAQASSYEDWIAQGEKNPHAADHWGMYVYKPVPPLSLFDPGVARHIGISIWLEAHKQNDYQFRPAQDASGLGGFGELSAAWALQVPGTLLAVLLGFAAFAGEREGGTLRQNLAAGVSPRALLLGKALAMLAVLALLLGPALLLALGRVLMDAQAGPGDSLLRLAALGAAHLLYLMTFMFLALAVSAWSRGAHVALALLLAIWMAAAVIAPRAIADLARAASPVPTQFAFERAMAEEEGADFERVLREQFDAQRWDDIPPERMGEALIALDEAGSERLDRHIGGLWVDIDRQEQLRRRVGLLTPLHAIQAVSSALAGTDLAHYRAFARAAERYRREFALILNLDFDRHAGAQGLDYKVGPELWRSVPPLDYRHPSAAWALAQVWREWLTLALACAGACLLALIAVRRLRP